MEKISIKGTPKTPTITFDPVQGYIEIKGRSIPENATEFYMPLITALKKFSEKKNKVINANFQMEYFNTSSSKCILDILQILTLIQKSNIEVTVNWFYEEDDEDMLKSGENYQDVTALSLKMIMVPTSQ